MIREITPRGPISGAMKIPGSKSFTNRAVICAALARGESTLVGASDSDDTALLVNGLNQMGVLATHHPGGLRVAGNGGLLTAPRFPIPVGNAGTTLRFLLSLSALTRGTVTLQVSARMAQRPNEPLVESLRALGADVRQAAGVPGFTVAGGILKGGEIVVEASRSSQFLSSLLMVAPHADRDLVVTLQGDVVSRSYIDMTLAVMRAFGVDVEVSSRAFVVRAGQRYVGTDYTVEPDASGASYAFAASAIAGGEVLAEGVHLPSLQGDIRLLEILREMGCTYRDTPEGVVVSRAGALRGVSVDMNTMPDVVPTLAVVALFAEGTTTIRNVAHLRHKESDRIQVLAGEFRKMGAVISTAEDGLAVDPSPLHGADLDPHDDHRMAMVFGLAGLRVPGVRVGNPGCVRKSFPRFWEEFERLR